MRINGQNICHVLVGTNYDHCAKIPVDAAEIENVQPARQRTKGVCSQSGLCCTNRVMAKVRLSPDGLIPQLS
jgi:hypothetical protein